MKPTNVKVSVIIPVCNQAGFIETCLRSVCEQTLKEIEIIVINDGSSDDSLSIINKRATTDSRITVIAAENKGFGAAVNLGIAKATGEYIGVVESDDFLMPNMYEKLYGLTKNGVDIVKCSFFNVSAENFAVPNELPVDLRLNVAATLEQNPAVLAGRPSIWSAIYRRDFLNAKNIRFLELPGAGGTDDPFFFETLFSCKSFIHISECLYLHRAFNSSSYFNASKNAVISINAMINSLSVVKKYPSVIKNRTVWNYVNDHAYNYLNACLIEDKYDYKTNYKAINASIERLLNKLNEVDPFVQTNSRPKNKKILIYNWAPYDTNACGGVGMYCRNLVDCIMKNSPTTEIYFLSSGVAYDHAKPDCCIQFRKNNLIKEAEIVNSSVRAPQNVIRNSPEVYSQPSKLKQAFKQFLESYGPFDIIHFNNLEGITFDVFDLKSDFKNTKFIYSMHNYNNICLRGSYYQNHTHKTCNKDHTAADCKNCLYNQALSDAVLLDFKQRAIDALNKNCDCILAVSKRVAEIAVDNGLNPNKVYVSYIGTSIAENKIKAEKNTSDDLTLVHLGNYSWYEEKGFPFLLNALTALDDKYASKINLKLTMLDAAFDKNLLSKFKSVEIITGGYKHDQLKEIFDNCDLSLIPVVWEDNLPQVAIESIAFGVPLLCSSAGGAKELFKNNLFTFKAGDKEDLLSKIIYFLENKNKIGLFWEGCRKLVTLNDHWIDLNTNYYKLDN